MCTGEKIGYLKVMEIEVDNEKEGIRKEMGWIYSLLVYAISNKFSLRMQEMEEGSQGIICCHGDRTCIDVDQSKFDYNQSPSHSTTFLLLTLS